MIVFLDGLSSTGKTFLTDKLIERNPDWIRFKGAGAINIGMKEHWQQYNFWMHNIIERLDQINNYKKIILWDRGITDSVYSEDENYRKEILRVSKSHISKCLLFLKVDESEWPLLIKKRNSKEGSDYNEHIKKYNNVIHSFPLCELIIKNTDNFNIINSHILKAENFIKNQLNGK